ncbi:methylisocitrate lyase [Friedmanniella endophytica]|uniref:Methylisocitrate lyase n=1 Tax=Microlunatus kandeliicorticis TaxID=1759536 RepID=A0A7W3IVJ8_9ACTN|nr:methylisocitrate lyase [Microlunatus kandeliicorticis]MBA8796053.1 methylisocitrate lyase [Microlunatus kandeliicorticis]
MTAVPAGTGVPAPHPASAARRAFRAGLESGRLLRFPGAFTPLSAKLITELGFDGVYISGAVLSAELGLPDIGLTTLTEVAGRAEQIITATTLPTLIDADTGFGEPLNVARTVRTLEAKGVSGCHLEDQVNPKRCGHLDGKALVGPDVMVQRIAAAVAARTDPDFVICARTDARGVDGFDAAVERARAYVAAGADLVFPEALSGPDEFAAFRAAVDAPLLANMTEFGKSPLLDEATLADLGFNLVIYPVTLLRLAMGAIEDGLRTIAERGTQRDLVDRMQTRARLYELVGYADYTAFDSEIFAFDVPAGVEPPTTDEQDPA